MVKQFQRWLKVAVETCLLRLEALDKKVGVLMSAVSDYVTKQKAHNEVIEKAVDGLTSDVKTLNDKITALQNSGGSITPEDQAMLDELEAKGQAIADKVAALDALTPPTTP